MPKAPVRKASVILERNGACIRIDDVPANQAGIVLGDMLKTFRLLEKKFPELIRELDAVNGGTPVDVTDDDYAEQGQQKRPRRVGFV